MNRYISSKEALDLLSAHAPRHWCKRLLSNLIFEGTICAFSLEGHLQGRVPAITLLDENEPVRGDGDVFWEAVKRKYGIGPSHSGAPTEASLKNSSRGPLAKITGARWHEDAAIPPQQLGFGYFYFADELDWDNGSLYIESIFPNEVTSQFFLDDDPMFHKGGNVDEIRFSWLEFEVEIGKLSFERSAIEMLTGLEAPRRGRMSSAGRPAKWDWTSALAAVVAEANTIDGLPSGEGAQAFIERIMAKWFITQTGNQPSTSQLRDHAQKVMIALAEKARR